MSCLCWILTKTFLQFFLPTLRTLLKNAVVFFVRYTATNLPWSNSLTIAKKSLFFKLFQCLFLKVSVKVISTFLRNIKKKMFLQYFMFLKKNLQLSQCLWVNQRRRVHATPWRKLESHPQPTFNFSLLNKLVGKYTKAFFVQFSF